MKDVRMSTVSAFERRNKKFGTTELGKKIFLVQCSRCSRFRRVFKEVRKWCKVRHEKRSDGELQITRLTHTHRAYYRRSSATRSAPTGSVGT